MPANTPKGLPYPLPSEPVAEGAQAIRNLAEAVDKFITGGAPSTTPPASPVEGQLWVYPADATAGIMWVLRYRAASSSAYKWEFVGGAPWYGVATNSVVLAVGSWNGLGPDFIAPRSGDYQAEGFFMQMGVPSPNQQLQFGIANASVGPAPVGNIGWQQVGNYDNGTVATLLTGIPTGQTLRLAVSPPVANCNIVYRALKIVPVRIS